MKLQDIRFSGERLIEAYGDGGFRLTDGRHEGSLLLLPHAVLPWACRQFEEFTPELLAPVLALAPKIEIVLLGTGSRQHFPSSALRGEFARHHIALEAMDTGAACRTFNVLVTESRRVAAALIAVGY